MKKCFAIDLRDEALAIAEYERMHRPGAVWPEVIADIRAQGYVDITIWRAGNRLFMLTEGEPVASPAPTDDQTQAILDRWDDVMAGLQQAVTGREEPPRWVAMKCVFDLREHTQEAE